MLQLTFIVYFGVQLIIPACMKQYFPFETNYNALPSFGGPNSWGDRIVPDTISGVWCAVIFLLHDWMFSVGKRTVRWFFVVNAVMLFNLLMWVMGKGTFKTILSRIWACLKCIVYWRAVTGLVGWRNFHPVDVKDPMQSPDFVEKLERLRKETRGAAC